MRYSERSRESADASPPVGAFIVKNGRLRVAVTHPTCWPEVRRGSERFLHEFSHFLAGRGHQVTVISTALTGGGTEYEVSVERVLLPQRHPLPFSTRWCTYSHLFAWQVASVLASGGYDAVHCLHLHDAWGATLARRWGASFRFVFQLTGIPLRRYFFRIPIDGWIFRAAVRDADLVLAASRCAHRMLKHEYGCDGQLLPPPTNTRAFAELVRPDDGGRPPRILFVGDLDEPRKGALLLAKAFALLRQSMPAALLEYSGRASATVRAAIINAVPEGLRPDITFLDIGEVHELPALYARATVVVNPAIWEALGMVLVEALAAGTPVVGCDHGGIPDIIDDPRIGCLFPPESTRGAATNAKGLADAIRRTIRLAARAETATLCQARAQAFAWDRIGPRYEEALFSTG